MWTFQKATGIIGGIGEIFSTWQDEKLAKKEVGGKMPE
jgi:hypothetical protein